MAEFSTPEERTEAPTDRRWGQMRKEGSLYVSTDVVNVVTLMTGFYVISFAWSWLLEDFKVCLIHTFGMIATVKDLDLKTIQYGLMGIVKLFMPDLLAILILIAIAASLSVMLQTNWNIKAKKINFKLDLLHPIGGLKRIFSIQGFVNTLKSMLKLILILPVGYFALKRFAPDMIKLTHTSIESVMAYTGTAILTIFWKIMYILIAMAIFDYFWGKHRWFKGVKMTKDEVKDERKSVEGDETTRRAIVSKGLRRIMQRIMSSVPKADVVITNPTHYSIALKYERDKMSAPIVVAKGKGFLALRIREVARENKVPVLERKTLARALYASTEVGAEIPNELFRAVAEVLAYVYKLKNPYGYNANNAGSRAT